MLAGSSLIGSASLGQPLQNRKPAPVPLLAVAGAIRSECAEPSITFPLSGLRSPSAIRRLTPGIYTAAEMPREDDRGINVLGTQPPLPEGPDLEAGAHASRDGPYAHQHSPSEERSPLVQQEAGASTSGAPDQTARAGADAQPTESGAAAPPEAEGAVETADGDLVRASAARQMCRKNKSPPA